MSPYADALYVSAQELWGTGQNIGSNVAWDEDDGFDDTSNALLVGSANGGTSLTNLNTRISNALDGNTATTGTCYKVSGTAAYALHFSGTLDCRADGKAVATATPADGILGENGGALPVQVRAATARSAQQHVDFERGASQTLIITGYSGAGAGRKATEMLAVNIAVENHDESPVSTQNSTTNRAPVYYMSKDDSMSVLISGNFRDPEGVPVYFDASATSTDVWVCDTTDAGQVASIDGAPANSVIATTPSSEVTSSGTAATSCSVSNTSTAAQRTAVTGGTSDPGFKGSAGNRVVTTRKVGPILHITADSVVTDDAVDGADPVDRPKGTYTAVVYYRVWTGAGTPASPRRASRDWAMATVHVKIGANNVPQFAGRATGYEAEMNEGSVSNSGPMAAWVAGDLDENGVNNDMLEYTLEGYRWFGAPLNRMAALCGSGVCWVHKADGDATATPPTVDTITLWAAGIDYEKVKSFTVNLQVTDKWSDPVSVPITVTVKDVNELNFAKTADDKDKKIEDQRLIQGGKRTFDLDDYFVDPEGDDITFSAHTNVYTNVASVGEGNVLTITGANTSKENPMSFVTFTVVATDGKLTKTDEFVVTTRFTNTLPEINLVKSGTVAIGSMINENDSAGKVLTPLIDFTDDDPAPTPVFNGAPHFSAVVEPYMAKGAICTKGSAGCAKQSGKVAIVVGKDGLNYESAASHKLSLALQDAWDNTKMSKPLEIQVQVIDDNDAPTVKKDMDGKAVEIADQSIVVNGSASLYTGSYFEDEDGDRLLVNATSSDMKKVTVSVSGLDGVKFMGVAVTEKDDMGKDKPVVVTLTATDPDGASASLMFNVTVGANNPPVADADAFMMALPENNTINVGAVAKVDLDGLFSEPDTGDDIMSVTGMTSDEDILLVIPTDDGDTLTLVGVASGMATLTITAMDGGGNSTDHMAEITVNEAPAEAKPIDPVEMDRTMPHVVDVSGVFTDGDDGADMLTITAEAIEGMDRVELEVMDGQLTITGILGVMPGMATIRLTATDPHGASASVMGSVTVGDGELKAVAAKSLAGFGRALRIATSIF